MAQDKAFRPRINEGLTVAIIRLFNTYPSLREYFNGDKKKFVQDAIRQNLIYYEDFIRGKS